MVSLALGSKSSRLLNVNTSSWTVGTLVAAFVWVLNRCERTPLKGDMNINGPTQGSLLRNDKTHTIHKKQSYFVVQLMRIRGATNAAILSWIRKKNSWPATRETAPHNHRVEVASLWFWTIRIFPYPWVQFSLKMRFLYTYALFAANLCCSSVISLRKSRLPLQNTQIP